MEVGPFKEPTRSVKSEDAAPALSVSASVSGAVVVSSSVVSAAVSVAAAVVVSAAVSPPFFAHPVRAAAVMARAMSTGNTFFIIIILAFCPFQ